MKKKAAKQKNPFRYLPLEENPAWNGNWLQQSYFQFDWYKRSKGLLPYPYTERKVGVDTCLVYQIPREDLQAVLDAVNPDPWRRLPVGRALKIPLTDGKRHRFSAAKIIHYNGWNYIVPPIFFARGVTACCWGFYRDIYQ